MSDANYETEHAIIEAHQVHASNEYFAARSHLLDTKVNRNCFEAGFKAAVRQGSELAKAVAQAEQFRKVSEQLAAPPQTPAPQGEMPELPKVFEEEKHPELCVHEWVDLSDMWTEICVKCGIKMNSSAENQFETVYVVVHGLPNEPQRVLLRKGSQQIEVAHGTPDYCRYMAKQLQDVTNALPLHELPSSAFAATPQGARHEGGEREADLAMLLRRMIALARRVAEDDSSLLTLSNKTAEFLRRKGLDGAPMREPAPTPPGYVQEWIPCSERLPEQNAKVLAYCPDHECHAAWFNHGVFKVSKPTKYASGEYEHWDSDEPVTHWMPLPAPPIAAAKGETSK
jgi:hypothetical protein